MALNIDRRKFQQLSKLEFMAKQAVEGFITGMHKSPFHGFSVEFAEHRLYNTGESTRHIDWKLYARSEKLFIKRYEEETNLRCHLVIDHSSSMYFPEGISANGDELNKLKFSIYASAALIELFRRQRDAVGLSLFAENVTLQTRARSSQAHHQFLYNELEILLNGLDKPDQKKTFTVEALHQVAETIPRRSLVIIFSDMMDNSSNAEEMFSALQHLKHNKHEVVLFHTLDKSLELDFDFKNRPYTFVDMESGEQIKVNPRDVRENYISGINEFQNQLKVKCGQYGIDYIVADINEGFNQILLEYLVKRKKLL